MTTYPEQEISAPLYRHVSSSLVWLAMLSAVTLIALLIASSLEHSTPASQPAPSLSTTSSITNVEPLAIPDSQE